MPSLAPVKNCPFKSSDKIFATFAVMPAPALSVPLDKSVSLPPMLVRLYLPKASMSIFSLTSNIRPMPKLKPKYIVL